MGKQHQLELIARDKTERTATKKKKAPKAALKVAPKATPLPKPSPQAKPSPKALVRLTALAPWASTPIGSSAGTVAITRKAHR